MSTLLGPPIGLDPNEIHLWLTDYTDVVDDRLLETYRNLLNADELAKQSRFYFERDRRCFLFTRALLRTTLSRYLPLRPHEWIFETSEHGRPYVANAAALDAGLSFNLSHTRSLIVLGVSQSRALGVDIENFRTQKISPDLARHYFSTREATEFSNTPEHRKQFRFFEYWTLKESYIKARGLGLQLPLDKFYFHYPDEKSVAMTIDAELGDDASRWLLWQMQIEENYLLAVCAERGYPGHTSLLIRRLSSLHGEQYLDLEPRRTSFQS